MRRIRAPYTSNCFLPIDLTTYSDEILLFLWALVDIICKWWVESELRVGIFELIVS